MWTCFNNLLNNNRWFLSKIWGCKYLPNGTLNKLLELTRYNPLKQVWFKKINKLALVIFASLFSALIWLYWSLYLLNISFFAIKSFAMLYSKFKISNFLINSLTWLLIAL